MDPNSTAVKVQQMIKVLGEGYEEKLSGDHGNKMITAANNLVYLARDKGGCELINKSAGFQLIRKYLIAAVKHRQISMCLALVRALSETCKNGFHSIVIEIIEIDLILDTLACSDNEELIVSVQFCIQMLLNDLGGFDAKKMKMDAEKLQNNQSQIDLVMSKMLEKCAKRTLSAAGRDALLELLAKNIDYQLFNWGEKALQDDYLIGILDIGAELEDMPNESSMRLTNRTKTQVSLVLERIYGCLYHDQVRDKFRSQVVNFVQSLILNSDIRCQLKGVSVITTLLNGPLDVGNQCIAQEGTVDLMISLAKSSVVAHQKIALEAIIAASTKKDKCTSIIKSGAAILKDLYDSPDDGVKVRALVGLCKLGSVGGIDASVRPFTSDQLKQLLDACRKFVISESVSASLKRNDLKRWAAEGLAFLTLDADIKEIVCDDLPLIEGLIKLAKCGNASVLYGVVTTFVNLTNSYDKKEIMPEMLELAKFAKQHVPTDHEKDDKEFVNERCKRLVASNLTTALVELAKTESETSREMIARIFNAITEQPEVRGKIVQQGGAKCLISLAIEKNTDKGKEQAAQAIARLAITINPTMAFPGERTSEIVRPLVKLLAFDCSGLQNFEALMALTNLAQVDSKIQNLILKKGGFSKIEHYMYEDNEMLKRAAVQCVANLILNPNVISLFEGENDRIKYLVALCESDDLDTAKAAAGALAMITSASNTCCERVFVSKIWIEVMVMLCSSKDTELQHRGLYLLRNLMQADKSLAEKICDTNLLEVLMAIVRPEVDDIPDALKALAQESLDKAVEYNLIKALPS